MYNKIKSPKLTPTEFITKLGEEIENILEEYPPSDASKLFSDMTRGYAQYKFGKDKFKRKMILWDEERYTIQSLLHDEILRVFFRLTQKPVGSLVPLFDLLDKTAIFEIHQQSYARLKFIFFRTFLAMLANRIQFPVKYYPTSAVFERDELTLEKVIALENVRAVLQGKCPHCNGVFPRGLVEAFIQNQIITCKYCNHSIKAEWHSDL